MHLMLIKKRRKNQLQYKKVNAKGKNLNKFYQNNRCLPWLTTKKIIVI